MNTNSIVMWGTLLNNADWDCFKTPIFAGDLEDSESTSVERCAFWEVIHMFQSVVDVQETNLSFA